MQPIAPIEIREEQPADIPAIRTVHRLAFGQEQEGRIVDALRVRDGVLLSLVALVDTSIVGHVLFSPATAGRLGGAALGPMAVLPAQQRQGVGSKLVREGLERLGSRGVPFIAVVGHPGFYARFGFEPAATMGATCDWEVPGPVFRLRVFAPEAVKGPLGRIAYRPEFSAVE